MLLFTAYSRCVPPTPDTDAWRALVSLASLAVPEVGAWATVLFGRWIPRRTRESKLRELCVATFGVLPRQIVRWLRLARAEQVLASGRSARAAAVAGSYSSSQSLYNARRETRRDARSRSPNP